ncbi:hypothetical protein Tco_1156568 [Tanacetum coccineum]
MFEIFHSFPSVKSAIHIGVIKRNGDALKVDKLTSGEIVSLNFIESIKEARSRVQDLTSGEIVSLNLLSRTRKFGHSTMELRSLIS